MPQPSIIRGRRSWSHFKENISQLIIEALLTLQNRADLVRDEISLNRMLRLCFRLANFKLELDYFPALDAENTQGNRPDLSWSIYNDQADKPEDCELSFVLECKRLGKKTSNNWILNEQYVTEGILRFFLEEKGYGDGCETGAMAGYIQDDMNFDDILQEVNTYITSHEPSIPMLVLDVKGWQSLGVSYLHHILQRSSNASYFLLQHFWLDMRHCRFSLSSKNVKAIVTGHQSQSDGERDKTVTSEKRGKQYGSKKQRGKISAKNASQPALPLVDNIDSSIMSNEI